MTVLPTVDRPWGALVAAYFVIIGLPSGLALVAWWLARRHRAGAVFDRYASWLSFAVLNLVGLLLVVDLGRPSRFFLMLTRFDNLSSPIAVGAKLIAVKTGLLLVAIWAVERHRRLAAAATGSTIVTTGGAGGPTRLGDAAEPVVRGLLLAASFALALYPAAVLSRTWSSPLAQTSGAALLFLSTALLLGAAAAGLLVAAAPARFGLAALTAPVRSLLLVLLAGHAVALLFQALGMRGDPRLDAAVADLTVGAHAWAWWAGVVAVGIAAPAAVLLAAPRSRVALAAAALTTAAGAGTVRYLLFAVGG